MEYDSNVCLLLMLECLALNKFHEWLGIFACSAASAVYKAKFCRCLTHKQTNKPNKAQFTQGGMAKQFKIHTIRILFFPPGCCCCFSFPLFYLFVMPYRCTLCCSPLLICLVSQFTGKNVHVFGTQNKRVVCNTKHFSKA